MKCVTLIAGLLMAAYVAAVDQDATLSAQDPPRVQVQADRNGDELPQGALARLGTLRWRHAGAVNFVAFLPDGKAVLTGGLEGTLRLWERDTGNEIRRFKVPAVAPQSLRAQPAVVPVALPGAGGQSSVALTRDGKTLAVALPNNKIQLWDVQTGNEIRQIQGAQNSVGSLLFSPDGKMLATRGNDRAIHLLDPETGNEIRQIKPIQPKGQARVFVNVPGGGTGTMTFSPDSKTIASPDAEFDQQKVTSFVRLASAETGDEIRRIEAMPNGASALAYSEDGKTVALAIANTIRLCDPDTGMEVRQIPAPAGAVMLLFAPDSKTLAVKGRDRIIRLVETETGNELHKLGESSLTVPANIAFLRAGANDTRDMAFSADGKTIATADGNTLRMWDTATGKEQPLAGGHRGPVSALSISSDGKTLLSRGADNFVRVWDVAQAEERCQFREPQGTNCVAFAPDGRTIALGTADGMIHMHEAATGKQTSQFRAHGNGGASTLVFSSDGKTLASYAFADNAVRVFDVAKATQIQHISLQADNPALAGAIAVRGGVFGAGGLNLAFSPDGTTVVARAAANTLPAMLAAGAPMPAPGATAGVVRMWDVATGKEIRKFALPGRGVGASALSPDGRALATENDDQTVSVWEIASGKERGRFGKPTAPPKAQPVAGRVVNVGGAAAIRAPIGGSALAFSPDGALLVCKGPASSLCIWEVATDREIAKFKGHQGPITAAAFTPDGKAVASGSSDTTILVWNVAAIKREPAPFAAELQPREVAELWTDLVGADAGKAFQGILRMTAAPKQTVPFLREHVKPAVPVDPKLLDKLIGQLGSEDFVERTAATEALEKLGDLAVPALQKTLGAQPILETRRRVEALLAKLVGGALTAEEVRVVRAVEVLERSGTPEARQMLESLAAGAPGALPTRQAQSVLDRLGKRQ
jgi:WD40 repeat protein